MNSAAALLPLTFALSAFAAFAIVAVSISYGIIGTNNIAKFDEAGAALFAHPNINTDVNVSMECTNGMGCATDYSKLQCPLFEAQCPHPEANETNMACIIAEKDTFQTTVAMKVAPLALWQGSNHLDTQWMTPK